MDHSLFRGLANISNILSSIFLRKRNHDFFFDRLLILEKNINNNHTVSTYAHTSNKKLINHFDSLNLDFVSRFPSDISVSNTVINAHFFPSVFFYAQK
jgi:hypothetical protein